MLTIDKCNYRNMHFPPDRLFYQVSKYYLLTAVEKKSFLFQFVTLPGDMLKKEVKFQKSD